MHLFIDKTLQKRNVDVQDFTKIIVLWCIPRVHPHVHTDILPGEAAPATQCAASNLICDSYSHIIVMFFLISAFASILDINVFVNIYYRRW